MKRRYLWIVPIAGLLATGVAASASASVGPGTPRCHTADLQVTVKPAPGGGAAGTYYYDLQFTNASKRTCTMFGYPGVSFVKGPKGIQVNTGFGRAVEKRSTITLRPKAIAHASIGLPNPGNFGPRCKPVSVRGFRVYPPDETKAVFVGDGQMACSARGVGVGTVFPVQSGAH